jgi:hypothetical protein
MERYTHWPLLWRGSFVRDKFTVTLERTGHASGMEHIQDYHGGNILEYGSFEDRNVEWMIILWCSSNKFVLAMPIALHCLRIGSSGGPLCWMYVGPSVRVFWQRSREAKLCVGPTWREGRPTHPPESALAERNTLCMPCKKNGGIGTKVAHTRTVSFCQLHGIK